MSWCLPKFAADAFRGKLISGEINPTQLATISSAERRAFFEAFLEKTQAKQVNALFESKLLLKNQQQGMVTWAKQVSGMKETVRRDIINKVEKLQKALDPADEASFLSDLVEQKLGVGVTLDEAATISALSKEIQRVKGTPEYGRARVEFENFIDELKSDSLSVKFQDFKNNPVQAMGKALNEAAGGAKAMKASLDNSAIGRQGLKALMTSPGIWLKNATKTFSDLVRQFGGKQVLDEVKAEIYNRPNLELYQKAKLAVGVAEEAFPTSWPGRIPVAGRVFRASEAAFTGFQYRNRIDLFDKYIDIAKRSGVDVSDVAQLQSIGNMVNSLTGRGNLGAMEPLANTVNNVFFSPRFVKSHIDTLTAHQFQRGVTPFVRKQAAINLLKITSGAASILVLADAMMPGSVEWDSRSPDFGKIRIGNTRFDVTGGMSSMVVLAARLGTSSTKSSVSGEIRPLNDDTFGATTKADVVYNFFSNKLSPAYAMANDVWFRGTDFKGEEPTLGSAAANLVVPLPITNYQELRDNPDSANILAAMIADALGIGTNTYGENTPEQNEFRPK